MNEEFHLFALILSYRSLTLIFSICYALFFFFILRNSKLQNSVHGRHQSEMLYLSALLFLFVLPWILYAIVNPWGFRNPDIFAYMSDSEEILRLGYIPHTLKENLYYAPFPMFTLLISSLIATSEMSSLQAAHLLNIIIQVLFWLSALIFIRKVHGSLRPHYVLIGAITAAYASAYFYGHFNTPLPQTMGLPILLLLFNISVRHGRNYSVVYAILLIASLVHVTVVPVLLLTIISLFLINVFVKRQRSRSSNNVVNILHHIILPVTIFSIYISYTIAIYPATTYLQKILAFIADLTREVLSGQVALAKGLAREILYPLNALGTALIIGATISTLLLHFNAVHKNEQPDNWLSTTAITATILIALGSLRSQFGVWGTAFFSISRYFSLPGFALATIVTIWVIANAFERVKRKRFVILLFIIILSAIGGLLDPLAFGDFVFR